MFIFAKFPRSGEVQRHLRVENPAEFWVRRLLMGHGVQCILANGPAQGHMQWRESPQINTHTTSYEILT